MKNGAAIIAALIACVAARTGATQSSQTTATSRAAKPAQHVPSRPETVVWGEFPADRPPVLTVRSGETVTIDTLSHQGTTQDADPVAFLTGLSGDAGTAGVAEAYFTRITQTQRASSVTRSFRTPSISGTRAPAVREKAADSTS
jgi:hypothetical protein